MKTALITGASEGIGYELTKIFANEGINLVLAARNKNRLQSIADELSVNNIQVKVYALDLSIQSNAEFLFNDLKSKSIEIDFLVNNAGFGINGEFVDIDWQYELSMYQLNMITLAYFTKMFANDMKQRGFGRILNVGSTGSFQPGPFMAGYCATKAFVLSLSEAVNYELRGSNVSVSVLCPGVTDTKFHAVAKTENTGMTRFLSHATAQEVAQYGFRLMMKRSSTGIYGLANKMMIFSTRLTCRRLVVAISGRVLRKKQ